MTCFETEKDYTHHISTIPINQIGFIDAKHLSITAFAAKKYCKRTHHVPFAARRQPASNQTFLKKILI